jgi:mono/diheme cytochrome c family protein
MLKHFILALGVGVPVIVTAASSNQMDLVSRGAYLAKAGDCVACHTAPQGKPFAGGLPMTTPMGRIYSTNITPDPETGIGHWTERDFERALRGGVSRDGHNLYPAMPYPSYAKVSDDDTAALYAYFMRGVAPVRQVNRASDIPYPLNMRWPLKIWNVLFLDGTVYQPKAGNDTVWNRGAYLVQGLGHCGACHTPRGIAFQEEALDETGHAYLTGAVVDNWFASNLTGDGRSGLGEWSQSDIKSFLKTGANTHASAFGGMTDVINDSTQGLTDSDLTAIARYLKSLPGTSMTPVPALAPGQTMALLARPASNRGAREYATYCMHCHGVDGKGYAPLFAPLAGNPNVVQSDTHSVINVTLNGTADLVLAGMPAAYRMPSYGAVLNDEQIAAVLSFVRAGWGNGASAVSVEDVRKIRAVTSRLPQ